MAKTLWPILSALWFGAASEFTTDAAENVTELRSNYMAKAVERIARIPEQHKVILELALVPVRKEMQEDGETLVRTLDDVWMRMANFPKESWYRQSAAMIHLYLELGALTNACRMLPATYIENAAEVAMYCLNRKNEKVFRHAYGEMLARAKENEGSESSHACYNLAKVGECAATNGYPAIAREVLRKAKRFAGSPRSFEAFMRERGIRPGEKISKKERRELENDWKEERKNCVMNRVLNLCEVAEREHHSGFEKEGRATMRTVLKEASTLGEDDLVFRAVVSRAVSIREYTLAEAWGSKLQSQRDKDALRTEIAATKGCFGDVPLAIEELKKFLEPEDLDGAICRMASSRFRAQEFEHADLLIESVADSRARDWILEVLVEERLHAGDQDEARRALSMIVDKTLASSAEELLGETEREPPRSVQDQMRYDRLNFCGTGAAQAHSWQAAVVDKMDPRTGTNGRVLSGSLAGIRSIGRVIGMESFRSDLLEFWEQKVGGSDLKLAYFYVGICEGVGMEYFIPAYGEIPDPRDL